MVAVAFALGVVSMGRSTPSPANSPTTSENGESLAGLVHNETEIFTNGLQIAQNVHNELSGTINPVLSNQKFITNTSGRTRYVDLVEMITPGTASSSIIFQVGTTSASTLSNFSTTFASLIDGFVLATSTTVRVVNSLKDAGTNGRMVIPWNSGENLFLMWRSSDGVNACVPTARPCETATSSRLFSSTAGVAYKIHWRETATR